MSISQAIGSGTEGGKFRNTETARKFGGSFKARGGQIIDNGDGT